MNPDASRGWPGGPRTTACSTSPTRRPTRRSAPCCWRRRRAAWSGSDCPTKTATSCSPTWHAGLAADARGAGRAGRDPARARPLLRGEARRASTCRSIGSSAAASASASCARSPRSPTARRATTPRSRPAPVTSAPSAPREPPAGATRFRLSSPATASCAGAAALGGYGGGQPMKRALLELEGVLDG